ncbi:BglG family transcription antiterminator [Iodobacter fluviatilis]|uniref:BglG family transcriptional antiterminator n=1 Tax=Iodobacter fluviatilis TaxID=537 RepID=A0A377Q3H2_9NEIS|nr:PRD domain-containing protein [Iodobacter fluviatilis]TCU82668.1 BglG family transcriptional antiterminator [Iodobacter fluviatilis]STQ89846.1 Probable licABCH operon regulator [Iodobacter fluviatilis]
MVRFPYKRLALLYRTLQAETLPQDELARRFSVSTRTVRTDITALNEALLEHGAQFVLQRGEGYVLSIHNEERFALLTIKQTSSKALPRTAGERVQYLLMSFLTSAYSLKLQDLADSWYVNRAVLQIDMAEVRSQLAQYQLSIETRPHYGMKLMGRESAIRVCLSDLLCQLRREENHHPLLASDPGLASAAMTFMNALPRLLARSPVRLSDEGFHFLSQYCAVASKRISDGFPIEERSGEEVSPDVAALASDLVAELRQITHCELSNAETHFLAVNIAVRSVQGILPDTINADDAEALVSYILDYINRHYHYDLRHDSRLRLDLLTHVKTMITRLRYQINLPNPVLTDIKQHYALAYDFTLSAVSSWAKHTAYQVSENEIGYLVLHIGVGLERHYQIAFVCRPQALLVCDMGNSTTRMIEAMLQRKFPQVLLSKSISQQDYYALEGVTDDFVISTQPLDNKGKPVIVVSPFPTEFQLEQLAKTVEINRAHPYMLDRYFDAKHFLRIDEPITQDALFQRLCLQLEQEGIVNDDFYPSVTEREAILSTIQGDGIAVPHSLGLLAKRSVVYTVLAPQGIAWSDGAVASVIFLLAISKEDYEEAMAIYDLFISLIRECASARLLECADFAEFKAAAIRSLKAQ